MYRTLHQLQLSDPDPTPVLEAGPPPKPLPGHCIPSDSEDSKNSEEEVSEADSPELSDSELQHLVEDDELLQSYRYCAENTHIAEAFSQMQILERQFVHRLQGRWKNVDVERTALAPVPRVLDYLKTPLKAPGSRLSFMEGFNTAAIREWYQWYDDKWVAERQRQQQEIRDLSLAKNMLACKLSTAKERMARAELTLREMREIAEAADAEPMVEDPAMLELGAQVEPKLEAKVEFKAEPKWEAKPDVKPE